MNYWYIPEEAKRESRTKRIPFKKHNLFKTIIISFLLAFLTIPIYLLIVLNLIKIMQ